ncbi:hypothetical protein LTR10_007456 [Elasticomyces elasticus]|nr:hypothetical protein LTR10_007456 [Elasticomyces elasticus]KAK4979265.1 hypothetical protein LTR42_001768 [Elasticomyces elasticus]
MGISLTSLAWTGEVIRHLTCEHGRCGSYEHAVERLIQGVAIINTVALSIAVQPLQSGLRSLIVDSTPLRQQTLVSACASFLVAVGGIAGFLAGSFPLSANIIFLHWMTQFQALALLTTAVVALTVTVTCLSSKELLHFEVTQRRPTLSEILRSMRKIPSRIVWICNVQFCAWIAWFCVLYYTTTYITELSTIEVNQQEIKETDVRSVQVGTSASLDFTLMALPVTMAVLLVLLFRERLRDRAATAHAPAVPSRMLARIWAISQALCGVFLLATLLPSSKVQGTILIALLGAPWAITQWVPFAILGNEIAFLQQQAVEQCQDELQSGVLLGVHNMAISAPQVIAGVTSSLIYTIAESADSRVPTAWILSIGSLAAFGASRLAYRLA